MDGPVSAEVTATEYDGMIHRSRTADAKWRSNIAIKVPLTRDGLKACRTLTPKGGATVNVTLCFSPAQALLAAKAGATFIYPFIGRLDDVGHDGMKLIEDIRVIFTTITISNTEILVASVRNPPAMWLQAATIGADVCTISARCAEANSLTTR